MLETEIYGRMAEHTSPASGTSRLVELLRRVGREEPAAVGFGRPRGERVRRAPLALVAALPSAAADLLTAVREAGADAALVTLADGQEITAAEGADGAPWPIAVIAKTSGPTAPADLDRWTAQGLDAIVLRPRAALAACFSPKRHNVLALLDPHLPVEGLRAAAALPVDGYVLDDAAADGRWTGEDLLWLALASGALRGPALVLSGRLTPDELEALVGMGVDGVAVRLPADAATAREQVAAWRAATDALDPQLRTEAHAHAERRPVIVPFRGVQG